MNILIVGVGLIGGSFSLALQRKKELVFGGYDKDIGALKEAKELGVVSTTFNDLDEGIKWAELIVLATPVKSIKQLLPNVLDQLDGAQLVVDFGSTKSSICEMVHMHPRRSQFIAAHPIAGTEHSGPSAAFEGLYFGKNLILCDTELSDNKLLERFEELALVAGFSLIRMSSDDHDRHLAYISHLSHITSYALSNAVLKK
ncbi:MAG: prephenate dehydrogenase/arogenate dehydrogenase family protein, partial [Ekhidna sp.]|nr:prephenate dehydrogenase/arogenate dehydrogenase family protein [Ekhidna sp.]